MKIDAKKLVYALRCSCSTEGYQCKKEECPYFTQESEEFMQKWNEQNEMNLPAEYFEGCDFDLIGLDAADYIEQMEGKS